jgi:hypothetical protein
VVSYLPEDFAASVMIPLPGRYFIQSMTFVDDFDYNKTQEQQCASKLVLLSEDGQSYEQFYTIGDKKRTWPIDEGQRLTGAPISETCNMGYFLDKSIKDAGMPRNRLVGENGPLPIGEAFSGVWADWAAFLPPGREKTRKTKEGRDVENRGIPIPVKFYLDGNAPTAPAQAAVPAKAPSPSQAPPPPPPPAPKAQAAPPPPTEPVTETTIGVDYEAMLKVVTDSLNANNGSQERKQVYADMFLNYDAEHIVKMEAMNVVGSAQFTEYMAAANIKLEGEVLSFVGE